MTQEMATRPPTEDGKDAKEMVPVTAAVAAAVSREEHELKTALVLAREFPRQVPAVIHEVQQSCQRPNFAEGATYAFPRGGSTISGPSVKLARELARTWGHIIVDQRIVSLDDRYVHLRVMARDLCTNAAIAQEDRFEKKIYRKKHGWTVPDERDLRELVNRRFALLERNCILKLLPPDIVDDAISTCSVTMEKAARGELRQSRSEAVRRLEVAFREFGVDRERLENYLQHDLDQLTDAELAELRQIYTSIRDSNTAPHEHFPESKKTRAKKSTPSSPQYAKPGELNREELIEALIVVSRANPDYLPSEGDEKNFKAILEKKELPELRAQYGRWVSQLQKEAVKG